MTKNILNHSDVIRLISIDPGTYKLGVAIYEINLIDRSILSLEADTWMIEKLDRITYIEEFDCDDLEVRLLKIRDHLSFVLADFDPHTVVIERPFFNRFKPAAYGAVVRVLETICVTCFAYNNNIQFKCISPHEVKKEVSAQFSGDKEKIKLGLKKKDDIKHLPIYNKLDSLGPDTIDAIAIGYSYIKQWQKSLQLELLHYQPPIKKIRIKKSNLKVKRKIDHEKPE
jgi:Holliday junction resolvasome RuvABC endonuclease subunit